MTDTNIEQTYRHTPDMGEISGFGGGYEDACQNMLEAGCKWLAARPDAKLEGHSYKGVIGIFEADSDDAKALDAVVMGTVSDCSGAMHHAVMSRLFYIAKNGWGQYCHELRKHGAPEQAA